MYGIGRDSARHDECDEEFCDDWIRERYSGEVDHYWDDGVSDNDEEGVKSDSLDSLALESESIQFARFAEHEAAAESSIDE